MQVIRGFVILAGLLLICVGLYLLALGVGLPIDIPNIQYGAFKSAPVRIGFGGIVAVFGIGLIWIAADKMKRTEIFESTTTTTTYDAEGRIQQQQQQRQLNQQQQQQ